MLLAYPRAPRCPTEVSTADRPAVAPLPALGFRGVPPRARRDQHAADSPDPRNHQSSELAARAVPAPPPRAAAPTVPLFLSPARARTRTLARVGAGAVAAVATPVAATPVTVGDQPTITPAAATPVAVAAAARSALDAAAALPVDIAAAAKVLPKLHALALLSDSIPAPLHRTRCCLRCCLRC